MFLKSSRHTEQESSYVCVLCVLCVCAHTQNLDVRQYSGADTRRNEFISLLLYVLYRCMSYANFVYKSVTR